MSRLHALFNARHTSIPVYYTCFRKDRLMIILVDTDKCVLANHFYVCGSGALIGVFYFELYFLAAHERIGSLQL